MYNMFCNYIIRNEFLIYNYVENASSVIFEILREVFYRKLFTLQNTA